MTPPVTGLSYYLLPGGMMAIARARTEGDWLMSNLEGRVALVTGSGQGIGHAVALELARRGATVVTNDVSGCCADDTLAEIRDRAGTGWRSRRTSATPRR